MSDVLEPEYVEGVDLIDAEGRHETEWLAEQKLVGLLLLRPELAAEIRALVTPDLFWDRPLGRVFAGLIAAEGFVPDGDEIVKWLGEKTEIEGRSGTQLVGYLRGLGAQLTDDDASVLAQRVFEAGETRLIAEVQVDVVGINELQSKMGLVTWSDRNSASGEDYDELVEGVIPEKELVIVIGATQAGKSFLGRHLAYCLARGTEFMGHRILAPVPVVWCAYEGGRGIKARDQAYEKATGFTGDMMLASLAKPIDLWSKEHNVEELIKEIKGIKRAEFGGRDPAAIFIDTHNAATPGASEIDSGDVSKIRDRYHRLRDVFGSAVIVIGHTNALGKMRGNEQLPNNAETVITVAKKTRTENRQVIQEKDHDSREVRTVELWKQREGQTGHLFDFVLPAYETGITNKFGKLRTSCVVAAPNYGDQPVAGEGKGKSNDSAAKTLGPIQTAYFKSFWDALQEHGQAPPPVLQLPRNTRVVQLAVVHRLYNTRHRTPDVSDNTIKSRRQRAETYFQNKNVLRIDNDHGVVWWTGKFVPGLDETRKHQRTMFDDMDERGPPAGGDFDFPED